eukprot:scaffold22065_cov64-Phaeocystis_antarctica.AAC.9
MAARLHVCPLGTLELEGVTTAAFADLDKHSPGLLIDDAWHTILVLQLTLRRDHGLPRGRAPNYSNFEGETAAKKFRRVAAALWYSR